MKTTIETNPKGQQEMRHTPTPWDYSGEFIFPKNGNAENNLIAEIHSFKDEAISHDSEFIVRAVNSHDRLVNFAKQALEELSKTPGNGYLTQQLRSAIAQAEGK